MPAALITPRTWFVMLAVLVAALALGASASLLVEDDQWPGWVIDLHDRVVHLLPWS